MTHIAIQEALDGKAVDWMETGQRRTISGLQPALEFRKEDDNEKTQTRKQRPGGLGHRLRLHGPQLLLRPCAGQAARSSPLSAQRSSAASPSSTPPRSMAPSPTRSCVGEALEPVRDQVVIATKFGFNLDPGRRAERPRQPSGAYPRGGRGVAEAAAARCHRPLLSAPRRPRRSDRGRGRRGEGR